jgi:ribose transport system ATP-binding protein
MNLSGGNQQKVVLAKTLATDSRLLIFDEPTRGIDVGARQEIYKLMCELAAKGHGILMITSDMEELLGMSDRIAVIAEGRLAGIVEKADYSQKRILELASLIDDTEEAK